MVKLTEREPRSVYLERFVIMLLLLVPSVFLQGWRSAFVAAFSVLMCIVFDAACCVLRKIPYDAKDPTTPFWGLAAALMMPASINPWLIVLSSFICIAVGKHLFGGADNIVFCPPAVSTAFLLICYPSDMLYFPKFGEKLAFFSDFSGAVTHSVEYSLNIHNIPPYSINDVVMGLVAGPVATVYAGIILVCGVCMTLRRSNSALAVFSCLLTAGLLAFFFPRAGYSGLYSAVYELSSGYMMFGTVFLAAEPYRIPTRPVGRILYGIMLGYTTMMFRFFGQTEGSFVFALLIICALCAGFDRVVENTVYWKKTYLNSFEKSKKQVQGGVEAVKLTDTQEIVIPDKYRFNMPPIDNKITHRKRGRKASKEAEEEVRRIIAEATGQPLPPEPEVKIDRGEIRDLNDFLSDDKDDQDEDERRDNDNEQE